MQIATFSRPFLAGATPLPYQNELKMWMKGAEDNNRHCNFDAKIKRVDYQLCFSCHFGSLFNVEFQKIFVIFKLERINY